MGHSPTQKHTFNCGGCNEEMSIDVIQHPETASCDIKCTLNCEQNSTEGLIVNLHPDFPVPEDQLHVDQAFPWLKHVQDVAMQQIAFGASIPKTSSLEELGDIALKIQTLPERWSIIKKIWSLARNGRDDLATEELKKYDFLGVDISPSFEEALFHFCKVLLNRAKYPLFSDAAELLYECSRTSPEEYFKLKKTHHDEWFRDHLDHYFDIFTEYFKNFGEFSQALLLCQYNLPIEEDAVASSSAFSRTKMFYGNAFEAITSHFVVLACLNNILGGRPFDQFQTMDIKKYLTINKANRAKPFSETKQFSVFSTLLNSSLRNASHHAAIKLDQNHKTIAYRSGGSGAEHKMRYIEYLFLCNDHVVKLAALLMLELVLMS